jgi:hypothetical protein
MHMAAIYINHFDITLFYVIDHLSYVMHHLYRDHFYTMSVAVSTTDVSGSFPLKPLHVEASRGCVRQSYRRIDAECPADLGNLSGKSLSWHGSNMLQRVHPTVF